MTKQPIENSEFQKLIGEWKTEGRILAKGNEPEIHISGTDSYEWILDGYYILHKADVLMGEIRGQTYELISLDEAGTKAKFEYYNNQGVSGKMVGMLKNNKLSIEGQPACRHLAAVGQPGGAMAGVYGNQAEQNDLEIDGIEGTRRRFCLRIIYRP
jgi:hypothetical protein